MEEVEVDPSTESFASPKAAASETTTRRFPVCYDVVCRIFRRIERGDSCSIEASLRSRPSRLPEMIGMTELIQCGHDCFGGNVGSITGRGKFQVQP